LNPTSSVSHISVKAGGVGIAGACDRQKKIPGFDQEKYSRSHVLCIGAGGLISHIAPALVRKGIGALTVLDADDVEASNLNRQRFYPSDIGQNKAIALVRNLQRECTHTTRLCGYAKALEQGIFEHLDLDCDIAVCGVDNNLARVAAARFFRGRGIPVIFTAVSAEADHGYVFIQKSKGACIGCVFPDIVNDESYPCPGTPAIADVLQLMGALTVYGVDSVVMQRKCDWTYRAIYLSTGIHDCALCPKPRAECAVELSH
jgi:adenylyltransferase/sulfurtransferase